MGFHGYVFVGATLAAPTISPQSAQRSPRSAIKEIHKTHMLTNINLSGIETGLLINFDVKMLKDGIKGFKI